MWQITIGYVGHFLLDFFLSNLDTRDLKTYLRDLFWSFLKYVNLKMMIPVLLFDTFTKG